MTKPNRNPANLTTRNLAHIKRRLDVLQADVKALKRTMGKVIKALDRYGYV